MQKKMSKFTAAAMHVPGRYTCETQLLRDVAGDFGEKDSMRFS